MTYTVTMMTGYYRVTVRDENDQVIKTVTATTKIEALRRAVS